MKRAEPPAPVWEIVSAKGGSAEGGDLAAAVGVARDAGMDLAGASSNVYAPLALETLDLGPYSFARLAQLGFTLLRLRPPRAAPPAPLEAAE